MFGPLGFPELIFILVLALLIFGPKRLPEIGRTIGRGMSEFRKASNDLKRTINTELALDEPPAAPILRQPRLETPPMTTARTPHPAMSETPETPEMPEELEPHDLPLSDPFEPEPLEPVTTIPTAPDNEPLEPR